MTDLLLQFGISNLCISLALALVAWAVHATGKRPFIAHLLWVLVLVKLVTPPIFTIPVLPVPSLSAAPAESLIDLSSLDATSAGLIAAELERAMFDPDSAAFDSGAITTTFIRQAMTGLILFWVLGSACVLAWSLVRIYRFNRLLAMAAEVAPPEVQHAASRIARGLGLKVTPTVYTTSAHLSPMVWWIGGRVRIVISAALPREMDAEHLRWILAHELAHVRRRDHLVRWLEWTACVIFWWNPVAWWARRNLRINEEICCDALVLASFRPRPQTYANALMTVVEFLASPAIRPPAVASAITSGGLLERRFKMIVSETPIRRTQRWLLASILVCAAGLLPLGMATAEAALPKEKGDKPAAKEKVADPFLEILSEAVALGVMDGKAAFELYLASQDQRKQEVVASGKATPEAFDHRMGLMFRYKIAEAELAHAVAKGEISEEDAKARLEDVKKSMAGDRDEGLRRRYAAAEAELKAMVEAGEITEEDARKRLHGLHEALAARGGEHDDRLRRRYEAAEAELKAMVEAGEISEEDARKRLQGLHEALAARGGEHDDRLRRRYEAAEAELKAMVEAGEISEEDARKRLQGLHEALAARGGERDDRLRRRYEAAEAELKAMVEAGEISEEDARKRLQGLHEALAARGGEHRRPIDRSAWEGIRKRIEGAVERGDMTREEADAMYKGIHERLARRDDRERGGERDHGLMRRIAVALTESGIEREQVHDVMGALERIAGEMQAEGEDFELNPRILVYLEKLDLTDDQIDLVVGLAQRLAAWRAEADRGGGERPRRERR
jgi:beta-lactamase regulating signal transducer with metallopeptidase domain/polyhydroxyalkanoate synthesis regulator phasin